MHKQRGFTVRGMKRTLLVVVILIVVAVTSFFTFFDTDIKNNMIRRADVMRGGNYDVSVIGDDVVYHVIDGKITSTPKGYYILYPTIDGKEQLVQLPIAMTKVVKVD